MYLVKAIHRVDDEVVISLEEYITGRPCEVVYTPSKECNIFIPKSKILHKLITEGMLKFSGYMVTNSTTATHQDGVLMKDIIVMITFVDLLDNKLIKDIIQFSKVVTSENSDHFNLKARAQW